MTPHSSRERPSDSSGHGLGWSSTLQRWRAGGANGSQEGNVGFGTKGAPETSLDTILEEFSTKWSQGERPRAEDYRDRLDSESLVELIYEEYCLAERHGNAIPSTAFLERFPEHTSRLSRLFDLHGALSAGQVRDLADVSRSELPEVGDEIGPYKLIRKLGSGGFARVFLAEQSDLADRLVVLKVATKPSPEPRLLARARHPYIVEILRHASAENGALHLICMPFLGGATVSTILSAASDVESPQPRRTGRDLLHILDKTSAPEFPVREGSSPTRDVLSSTNWNGAWCWIIARLGEALEHAYLRGVTHGDVKPSNILLAADASPMLFDFNLAIDWRPDVMENMAGRYGGTLAYMAPERLEAVASPSISSIPQASDRHNADLYSLGLVLLEATTGFAPSVPQGKLAAREAARLLAESRNQGVSFSEPASSSLPAALKSVLDRCLAADPRDRYSSGGELAEDLDRFRLSKPLKYAAEPRGLSLFRRRLHRYRRIVAAAGLVVVFGVGASATTSYFSMKKAEAQVLALSASFWDNAETDVFRLRLFGRGLNDPRHDRSASSLKHLSRFGVLDPGDWRDRHDVPNLPKGQKEDLEAWVCEQAWRYARDLFVRSDDRRDWIRAAACLRKVYGVTPAVPLKTLLDRISIRLEGEQMRAKEGKTCSPFIELYLRGVEAEYRDRREARNYFERALATKPDSFWASYRAAVADFRQHDYKNSALRLKRCVKMRPGNCALRTQLAGTLFYAKDHDSALCECAAALAINPDFPNAIRTRAMILKELGEAEAAAGDIRRYEQLTQKQGMLDTWRLRSEDSISDSEKAKPEEKIELLKRIVLVDPMDLETRVNLASALFASNQTDEAVEQLDGISKIAPSYLYAKFGRAMIEMKLGQEDKAVREMEAILQDPGFEDSVYDYYMMLHMYPQLLDHYLRVGSIERAIVIGKRGVGEAERLEYYQGQLHYALARAYTVQSATNPECARLAARELEIALKHDPDCVTRLYKQDHALGVPQREAILGLMKRESALRSLRFYLCPH